MTYATDAKQQSSRNWPSSPGEMALRIRDFAVAGNCLGAAEGWPPSLRAAIDLILPCGFPMIILWGSQLIQLYNDRCRGLMGLKHPSGLGQPTRDCWPEAWHISQPIFERVWAGETLTFEDALYPTARSGAIENAWFTITYSPLRDEMGRIAGILVTLFETTARKIAEQHRDRIEVALRASERRQGFLLRLADGLRQIRDPIEVQLAAARILGEHLRANRVAYAEDCGDGETVALARNYTDGVPGIEGIYRYVDYGEELVRELRAGRAVVRPDIANDPSLSAAEKEAHAILQLGATLNVPLVRKGRLLAILAVHYAGPHAFSEEEIALAQETAERTWGAVELARAETALRQSEEQLKVLVDELKHRTRNLLAIIQSIAHRTLRTTTSLADFERRFTDRLKALGQAQDILSKSDDTEITLRSLVMSELEALGAADLDTVLKIDGPPLRLRNSAVQTLALAIHELATNARKYGALSRGGGGLAISWRIEHGDGAGERLVFAWRETGISPLPGAEEMRGYGRYLIERAMPLAFGGASEYSLRSDGLSCVFSIPLSKVLKA